MHCTLHCTRAITALHWTELNWAHNCTAIALQCAAIRFPCDCCHLMLLMVIERCVLFILRFVFRSKRLLKKLDYLTKNGSRQMSSLKWQTRKWSFPHEQNTKKYLNLLYWSENDFDFPKIRGSYFFKEHVVISTLYMRNHFALIYFF